MGCDIHAIWQVQRGRYWCDVPSEYKEGRNYALFERLAGVRGEVENAISAPRGLPPDFDIADKSASIYHEIDSDEALDAAFDHLGFGSVRITKWMGDHSHSWLMAGEILSAQFPEGCEYFVAETRRLRDLHGEAMRIVFGFDS